MSSSKTHYDVLGLKQTSNLTPEAVKVAYRDALLAHHPDRLKNASAAAAPASQNPPTIDQVVTAYNVLFDSKRRVEYDRAIAFKHSGRARSKEQLVSHEGIESYDLEDLTFNQDAGTWSKTCRCGNEKGFVVTETELEEADERQFAEKSKEREVLVGCQGCSLFIRVTFAVEPG